MAAFSGVEKIASGFLLYCDVTPGTTTGGGTTWVAVPGLVDVKDDLDGAKSEKTGQGSGGRRGHLASLRAYKWQFSFRWDQIDATAVAHKTLYALALNGVIANWKLVYPGAATDIVTRIAQGFITDLNIPNALGEVITATMDLQLTTTKATPPAAIIADAIT